MTDSSRINEEVGFMAKKIVVVNEGPRAGFLISGDTLQLKDYSKTDWEWSSFDPEHKKERHETVFPQECKKAYEMGKALLTK